MQQQNQNDKLLNAKMYKLLQDLVYINWQIWMQQYDAQKKGWVNEWEFMNFLAKVAPQYPQQVHKELYNFICNKYHVSGVNIGMLDEVLYKVKMQDNLAKQQQQQQQQLQQQQQQQQQKQVYQYPQQQEQQQIQIQPEAQTQPQQKLQKKPIFTQLPPSQSTDEIYLKLQKQINRQRIDFSELFQCFDQDGDKQLNSKELELLLENIMPQLSQQDKQLIIKDCCSPSITLFALQRKIQNVTQTHNSQKILESNIYENPNKILSSKINFQNKQDDSIHGVKEFYQKLQAQGNSPFTDPTFPPNNQSLGPKFNLQWKRFNYELFVKSQQRQGLGKWISPADINQGSLGDCYFLASLSSIVYRKPDLVLNLFITRQANAAGMYCLKLCIDGVWRTITLDNHFPVQHGQLAFTQGKELWPMLLEKAWAKIFQNYTNIIGGYPREVLRAVTGAPTKTIFTDSDDFLEELEKACKEKCILVSGSQDREYQGLIPGHAYSVLSVKNLEKERVKLVKLRNPWGKKEWTGEWSDKSKKWTPQIKQMLNVKDGNDGIFYMDIGDFMQNFTDIQICYARDNYQYSSQNLAYTKSLYFALKIRKSGEYFISALQRNKRHQKNSEYCHVRMIIGKWLDKDNFVMISSVFEKQIECWSKVQLEANQIYVVQLKLIDKQDNNQYICPSIYGVDQVKINLIDKKRSFLYSIYRNMALKNKNKSTYKDNDQIVKCHEFNINEGMGYFYVQNNQKNKKLCTKVTFEQMKGMKLKKPDRGNSLEIELGEGQEYLALFSLGSSGYSYQMKEQYRVIKE